MAFTTASMLAVNQYLEEIALKSFRFLEFRYEPQMIFGRQLREVVAEKSSDFAKRYKNKRWLLVGYARQPLTYQLKRADTFSEQIQLPNGGELYEAVWKRREVHSVFKYMFVSPSTELLEEVEENLIVRDLGYCLYPNTEVVVFDDNKQEKYRYPFEFLVNIERFEMQNFDHIDDMNEGVFSIFTMNANVNYPVFTLDSVYDQYGLCTNINLKVDVLGDIEYVEIPEGTDDDDG